MWALHSVALTCGTRRGPTEEHKPSELPESPCLLSEYTYIERLAYFRLQNIDFSL